VLCVCDVRDIDKDAQEIRLENASGWAMVWDPSSAQVSRVIFQSSLSASVEVVSLVEVIWPRRVGLNMKNNKEHV
jgi:hypothetical protein